MTGRSRAVRRDTLGVPWCLGFRVPWASLVDQKVKRLPAMRETWVRYLGREGPLEKEIATHSSNLAWKIPWTEEPGGLQSTGLQRVGYNQPSDFTFFLSFLCVSRPTDDLSW